MTEFGVFEVIDAAQWAANSFVVSEGSRATSTIGDAKRLEPECRRAGGKRIETNADQSRSGGPAPVSQ